MQCPKCNHRIYIKLTPEELVFCPYCDQRLIPNEEFNFCPTCGGKLTIGSVYCSICAQKSATNEPTIIDQSRNQPVRDVQEDIEVLLYTENPAVQKAEPCHIPLTGETPASIHEETTTQPQAVEESPKEPTLILAPITTPLWLIEEEPTITSPQAETVVEAKEDIAPLENGEPVTEEKLNDLPVTPVQEIAPPTLVEETLLTSERLSQASPVPTQEDIAPMVNIIPSKPALEPSEACEALNGLDTPRQNEFSYCFACGQKLPLGAFCCPRCGKSMKVNEFLRASVEPLQTSSFPGSEDAIIPENRESLIINEPKLNLVNPPSKEIPLKANREPASQPLQYAQPKYRPVAFRESVSEAMHDKTPSMPPYPRAKISTKGLKLVWLSIKDWTAETLTSARDFFSMLWQQRKFYGKSVRENDRPLIDLSSAEVLKLKQTTQGKAPSYLPMCPVYIILGAIVFVALFVIIGLTMSH